MEKGCQNQTALSRQRNILTSFWGVGMACITGNENAILDRITRRNTLPDWWVTHVDTIVSGIFGKDILM